MSRDEASSALQPQLRRRSGGGLARQTFAIVLAGGRGSRLGAHRLARQARGALRRQVPHHRFRALQLRQLRHPPHRHRHAVQGAEPDPPRAARLELPRRPLQRVRRAAAGAAARHGRLVPRHGGRRVPEPRHPAPPRSASTCWCSPATTSTRWITRDDRGARRARGADVTVAASRCRSPMRASFGVHARSTPTRRVTGFQEKPAQPRPMPGRPDTRARQHGHLRVRRAFLYEQLIRDADDPRSSHDFGKDIIPRLIEPRPRLRAPLRRQLRQHVRRRAVLARRRHDRRLLGSEHRAHQVMPELNLYDRAGRSGPTRSSCRPRSSSSTTTAGAASRSIRWSRAAASSAARRCGARCCSPTCTLREHALLEDSVVLPDVDIGRGRQLRRAVVDRYCRLEARVARRGPQALHVTDKGVTLITPEMLGQQVHQLR